MTSDPARARSVAAATRGGLVARGAKRLWNSPTAAMHAAMMSGEKNEKNTDGETLADWFCTNDP